MGTGKSGRYLNTNGSKRTVSDFALVHSNEGKYTKPQRGQHIRLVSGGHGQTNTDQLKKYGIPYNIFKTYPNGVRVGNIPTHKSKTKRTGIGQAWFPKTWTPRDIKHAGEHVASLKHNRNIKDGNTIYGMWKGVRVGVKRTNGRIATVFPDSHQPYKKKGR